MLSRLQCSPARTSASKDRAAFVGTAVPLRLAHAVKQRLELLVRKLIVEDARDTAHRR